MIKPAAHKVVVKPNDLKKLSEGGIIIPERAQKKEGIGTVVIAGMQSEGDVQLLAGDKVLYSINAGTPYTDKGVQYMIINEEDIIFKYDQ